MTEAILGVCMVYLTESPCRKQVKCTSECACSHVIITTDNMWIGNGRDTSIVCEGLLKYVCWIGIRKFSRPLVTCSIWALSVVYFLPSSCYILGEQLLWRKLSNCYYLAQTVLMQLCDINSVVEEWSWLLTISLKQITKFCELTTCFTHFYSQALKPDIKVYAAEPKNADDCARSIAAGRLIPNASPPQTVADALR